MGEFEDNKKLTLEWVNSIRVAHGKKPRKRMPRFDLERRKHRSNVCPVARALGRGQEEPSVSSISVMAYGKSYIPPIYVSKYIDEVDRKMRDIQWYGSKIRNILPNRI